MRRRIAVGVCVGTEIKFKSNKNRFRNVFGRVNSLHIRTNICVRKTPYASGVYIIVYYYFVAPKRVNSVHRVLPTTSVTSDKRAHA